MHAEIASDHRDRPATLQRRASSRAPLAHPDTSSVRLTEVPSLSRGPKPSIGNSIKQPTSDGVALAECVDAHRTLYNEIRPHEGIAINDRTAPTPRPAHSGNAPTWANRVDSSTGALPSESSAATGWRWLSMSSFGIGSTRRLASTGIGARALTFIAAGLLWLSWTASAQATTIKVNASDRTPTDPATITVRATAPVASNQAIQLIRNGRACCATSPVGTGRVVATIGGYGDSNQPPRGPRGSDVFSAVVLNQAVEDGALINPEGTSNAVKISWRQPTQRVQLGSVPGDLPDTATVTATVAPLLDSAVHTWDPSFWLSPRLYIYRNRAEVGRCDIDDVVDPCVVSGPRSGSWRAEFRSFWGVFWSPVYNMGPEGQLVSETDDSGTPDDPDDDVDLLEVAGLFPIWGPEQVCERLLFYPGTHASRYSPSDEYLACDAAASVPGATPLSVLKAAMAAGAAGAGLAYWLIWDREAPGTSPVDPDGPSTDDPPPPGTGVAPTSSRAETTVNRLLDRAKTANIDLAPDDAAEIARRCVWQLSRAAQSAVSKCQRLPIFAPGSDVAEATRHDLEALETRPDWTMLTYRPAASNPLRAGWKNAQPACNLSVAGQQCDEFPFRASQQNDTSASLKQIDETDNRLQGSRYSQFLRKCGLATSSTPNFLVVPITPSLGIPTAWVC